MAIATSSSLFTSPARAAGASRPHESTQISSLRTGVYIQSSGQNCNREVFSRSLSLKPTQNGFDLHDQQQNPHSPPYDDFYAFKASKWNSGSPFRHSRFRVESDYSEYEEREGGFGPSTSGLYVRRRLTLITNDRFMVSKTFGDVPESKCTYQRAR